jgi:hypothetical protein
VEQRTVTQSFVEKIFTSWVPKRENSRLKLWFYAGEEITRQRLGLPESWEKIQEWIDNSRDVTIEKIAPAKEWTVKNPEIPDLKSYATAPEARFWKFFPTNYPVEMKKSVNVENLKKYVAKCYEKWTLPQKRTASRAVEFLEGKKPAALIRHLPGLREKNASSATENGKFMTDVLVTWVKKGFVAGPFDAPPHPEFRVNPLMTAVQKTKVQS